MAQSSCAGLLACLVVLVVTSQTYSQVTTYPTFASYLEASQSTIFLKLVKALKLESAIEGSYTLFLPTDKAFATFFTKMNVSTNDPNSLNLLVDVFPVLDLIRYHFSPQVLPLEALPHGQRVQTFLKSTMAEDKLRLTVDRKVSAPKVVIRGWESYATVLTPDVPAGKGMIHVVDNVLLPKIERDPGFYPFNLLDIMVFHRLSVFQAAVGTVGADFWDRLKNQATPVTLMIPTDEAFMAALNKMGTTLAALPADKLKNLLFYHIADGYGPTSRMVEQGSIKTWKPNSSWIFTHTPAAGVVVQGETNKANIIIKDSFTGMGSVVHVIDTLLVPKAF